MIDAQLKQSIVSAFADEAGIPVMALTKAKLKIPFISSCMGFYIANGMLSSKQKVGLWNTVYKGKK